MIITSVYETRAQGVTTIVNGVRQDRDEDDKDLLLFARLPRHAKVSSSVCVQTSEKVFAKQQRETKFAGELEQDVLTESFLAGRHAAQCKDR